MLELAIIAFVVSLLAGALGFTDVSRGAATIAKITFGIFLIAAVVLLVLFVAGASIVL